VVDHDVEPGVQLDQGEGDAWPGIRGKLLDADLLVSATPTWIGQHSRVAQRVLGAAGRRAVRDRRRGQAADLRQAVAAVVGNEEGAHHISAVHFQGLDDVGSDLAANAVTCRDDEVHGQARDYEDLPETPEGVAPSTTTVADDAAHLARVLTDAGYPPALLLDVDLVGPCARTRRTAPDRPRPGPRWDLPTCADADVPPWVAADAGPERVGSRPRPAAFSRPESRTATVADLPPAGGAR